MRTVIFGASAEVDYRCGSDPGDYRCCENCAYYDGYECRITGEFIAYPQEDVVCAKYDGEGGKGEYGSNIAKGS